MQCFFQNNCNQGNLNQNNFNEEYNSKTIINQINEIINKVGISLPQGFRNRWHGGSTDRLNLANWNDKMIGMLNSWSPNCHNTIHIFNIGKNLYNMKNMNKSGPLANYYKGSLWLITRKWMDMLNYIITQRAIVLIPRVGGVALTRPETYRKDQSLSFYQTFYNQTCAIWNQLYTGIYTAAEISKNNYYNYNQQLERYLDGVYNNGFINERIDVIKQNGSKIDRLLYS